MKRIKAADFVKLWQGAKSMEEIVQKSGQSKNALTTRAAQFRKHGVKLQKFQRGTNWKALAELAESLK